MQRGRSVSLFSSALLTLGFLVSLGSIANAETCVRECAIAKRDCVHDSRVAKLACKLDCRTNSDPTELGDCMRGCMQVAREAKTICRAIFTACKQSCEGGTTTSTVQGTTTSSTVQVTTSSTVATTTTTSTTVPGSASPGFID